MAEQLSTTLAPVASAAPAMGNSERDAALALLRDPQLVDRNLADFARAGVVGGRDQQARRVFRGANHAATRWRSRNFPCTFP